MTDQKWREAGWASPDAVLAALTQERLRTYQVYAVLDRLNALKPEQFKTGQGHLPAAFREIDFRKAFETVVNLVAEIEEASGYNTRSTPPVAGDA